MIKTIQPVLLDPMTGYTDVVYFDISRFLIDEKAPFKEQVGKILFEVNILVKDAKGKFRSILPRTKTAEYKLTTFLGLYGGNTFNNFMAQKDTLAIAEIAYNNSMYWGLQASDLEVYTPIEG